MTAETDTPGQTASARWDQVLDAFEACLAEQERQLDEDPAAELVAFTPPAGLGPMPAEVSERAGRLLLRAGQLGDRVASQLTQTRSELTVVRRAPRSSGGRTAYVDRMA